MPVLASRGLVIRTNLNMEKYGGLLFLFVFHIGNEIESQEGWLWLPMQKGQRSVIA